MRISVLSRASDTRKLWKAGQLPRFSLMDGFAVPTKFTESKLIEYIKNQLLNKATLLIAAAICGAIIKHFTPTEVDRVIDKVLLACGVPESALKTLDSIIPGESDDDTHAH